LLKDDLYDPDLHGAPEQMPPAAQRGMALALTVIIVAVPFIVWAVLS
jgi:hypothetical protein